MELSKVEEVVDLFRRWSYLAVHQRSPDFLENGLQLWVYGVSVRPPFSNLSWGPRQNFRIDS